MIGVSECAEHAKNTQTPTIAIVIPASGVQRPRNRNTHRRNHIREVRSQSSIFKEMRGSVIEQNHARQHTLKQKTSAGPALGEFGILLLLPRQQDAQ